MRALTLLAASLLAPGGGDPAPRIAADHEATEFGTIFRGEVLHTTFTLANRGTADLAIQKITNSCQCTASRFTIDGKAWSKEELVDGRNLGVLAPGEEALLEVTMRTASALVPGKDTAVKKEISVYSNDPERGVFNLALKATMISPFTIEPEKLEFGVVRRGARARQSAIIWSDTLGDFPITGASAPNPESVAVTVTRLEARPGVPPTWRVDAELLPTAPLGTVASHVDLALDHERVKEIQIPVVFDVQPSVTFADNKPDQAELLDFEVMAAGSAKTIELSIENADRSIPYVLRSAQLSNCRPTSAGFAAEVIEVEKGMKYTVKVTAPATLGKASYFQGDLVLTADHPDVPLRKLRFRGWYKSAGKSSP